MKFRISRIAVALALLALTGMSLMAAPVPASAQSPKQVYAFYFPWWTNDSWGDGRLIDRPANQYDSRDGGAVGRQVGEAMGAGIDGFIVDWYGPQENNLTSQVFNMLLDIAGGAGFKAAAAVDLNGPYANSPDQVLETMNYVVNDRANHPAYLRFNGKPVIYFWNQNKFSVADWKNIRNQVDPNHNTIWVMEGTSTGYLGVFDSLYLFNVAWAGNPGATARQWKNTALRGGGGYYTPTVLPGWDESRMTGRSNPSAIVDRAGGAYLTKSWNGAVSANTTTILITSWNEYFENSYIEPSQSYGTQSLDVLRPLIAAWKAS